MIKIDKVNVMNFENAIRGARNPMNSWNKMDSYYDENGSFVLGENDLSLATRLRKAGTADHRKYLRQIFVSVDILAPMYWWKEYDTYKVATVANSTSTMHKIHSKPFELDDFSHEHLTPSGLETLNEIIKALERFRLWYKNDNEKKDWYNIIQLLPSSYNQLRTCTFNYETLINMYKSRKNHKLDEWKEFCKWVETLPYAKELIALGFDINHVFLKLRLESQTKWEFQTLFQFSQFICRLLTSRFYSLFIIFLSFLRTFFYTFSICIQISKRFIHWGRSLIHSAFGFFIKLY